MACPTLDAIRSPCMVTAQNISKEELERLSDRDLMMKLIMTVTQFPTQSYSDQMGEFRNELKNVADKVDGFNKTLEDHGKQLETIKERDTAWLNQFKGAKLLGWVVIATILGLASLFGALTVIKGYIASIFIPIQAHGN